MKFSTRKREVHYFIDEIQLDGWWFELDDLIETLEAVKEDDVFIRNKRMADALVRRKVLRSGGSRRSCIGATIGLKYEQFLARMKEYKRDCEGVKMTKDELITRLVDLIDDVEHVNQEDFDDGEIEDLIVEARIPITRSNRRR